MTWNVQPFQQFLHKKINSLFLSQESTLEVSEQQCFAASENCWSGNIFAVFYWGGKKSLNKKTGIGKTSSVQCISMFTHIHTWPRFTCTSFLCWTKNLPQVLGLSRRKHMVEGTRNLSQEKATEPENNSKMRTGLQQLNLKAAEKLLGCYEQKVWFQSIILVIHYVLCKRLWGLGLISIISLHCK